MTRREFLGYTALAALPVPPRRLRQWRIDPRASTPVLKESVLGYRGALPESLQGRYATLVVYPTCVESPHLPGLIEEQLHGGATVIVESGAAFLLDGRYRAYQRWMWEELGIRVTAPVNLWSGATRGVPYIEYDWPTRAIVRDYSRVVPVADQPGEVIGWAGKIAVALKRRIGKGTLIYLGSPLGPALWAGDLQARRWLQQVFAS